LIVSFEDLKNVSESRDHKAKHQAVLIEGLPMMKLCADRAFNGFHFSAVAETESKSAANTARLLSLLHSMKVGP
jgi:hypothetical protein